MSRLPDPVDPSQSLWHLFGAALRHWRTLAGLSLQGAAKGVLVDWSLLGRWERGERPAPVDAVERLDKALGAGGILIALHTVAVTKSASGPLEEALPVPHADDMDQLRRKLLVGIAGAGVSAVAPLEGLGQLRAVVDRRVGASGIGDWEETAWEYSLQMASRPPTTVIRDLSLDMLAFQQAMGSAPGQEADRWGRLNARFMFLLADALGSAGQGREARHWWASARRAAGQTGDHQVMALVHASEALHGLYEDRPLALVLSRVDTALELTASRPCQATARALGARAHALTLAGDHASAYATLDEQADVYDALPDHITRDQLSMDGWPLFRLLHTRSLVYALSGHPHAAQAQREALAAHPVGRPRQTVQVRLHEAISAVRAGDVDDGLEHARCVVAELGSNTNRFVLRTAALVADAVPAQAQTRTTVLDYRRQFALPQGEG